MNKDITLEDLGYIAKAGNYVGLGETIIQNYKLYLMNTKIEGGQMNKEMQDLFCELKQYLVQHSPKWNTLCDIEQYIIDLQTQLEEKDKIINEAREF